MVSVKHERDGTLVITPKGELCVDTLRPFQVSLEAALDCGHRRVVVDLDQVELLSAAALHDLVVASERLETEGAHLIVRRAHGIVARVFSITGLDHLLDQPGPPAHVPSPALVASPGRTGPSGAPAAVVAG